MTHRLARFLLALVLLGIGACSADKPKATEPSGGGWFSQTATAVEAPRETPRPSGPGPDALAHAVAPVPAPSPPPPVEPSPSPAPAAPDAVAPDAAAAVRISEEFPVPAAGKRGRVRNVVDGDTVWLEDGSKIRYIGINTPERGTPLYEEAKAANSELVMGKAVLLEHDKEKTDTYGRDLAYVYVDGLLANAELVRRGLAYVYRWHPNTKYHEQLMKLQREARLANRGLWALPLPAPERLYVADQKGHVFHRPGCASAKKISGSRRLEFETRNDALDSGRNPDRECTP